VRFANPSDAPAVVVSVTVLWTGEPLIVEQELTAEQTEGGEADVEFNAEHTLPVGAVEFLVALYRVDGGQPSFRKTFFRTALKSAFTVAFPGWRDGDRHLERARRLPVWIRQLPYGVANRFGRADHQPPKPANGESRFNPGRRGATQRSVQRGGAVW
jgi:hypothetical protein